MNRFFAILILVLSVNTFAQNGHTPIELIHKHELIYNDLVNKRAQGVYSIRDLCYYAGYLHELANELATISIQLSSKNRVKKIASRLKQESNLRTRRCFNGGGFIRAATRWDGSKRLLRKNKKIVRHENKLKKKLKESSSSPGTLYKALILSEIKKMVFGLPIYHSDEVGPLGINWKPDTCYSIGQLDYNIELLFRIESLEGAVNPHLQVLLKTHLPEMKNEICFGPRYTDKYRRERQKIIDEFNAYLYYNEGPLAESPSSR